MNYQGEAFGETATASVDPQVEVNREAIQTNADAIRATQQQITKGFGFCGVFPTNPITYQTGRTLLTDNRSEFFRSGYYEPGLDDSSAANGTISFMLAQNTQTPYGLRWTRPAGVDSVVFSWRTFACFEGLATTDIDIGMRINRVDGSGDTITPYECDTRIYAATGQAVVYQWKSERTLELPLKPAVAFVDLYVVGGTRASGITDVKFVVGTGFQCQLQVQQM